MKEYFRHNDAMENATHRIDVIPQLLSKLLQIRTLFEKQTVFRFIASSLLFVYEGDTSAPFQVDVRIIDFAHVQIFEHGEGQIDVGFLKGLNNVIGILEGFLK